MKRGEGTDDTWTTLIALALVAALAAAVSVGADGTVATGSGLIATIVAAFTIGRWAEYRSLLARPVDRGAAPLTTVLATALARCRRFDRPLVLVRLPGAVDVGTRAAIADQMRTTDDVCHEADATVVLLPNESEIGALAWVRRLQRTLDLGEVAVAQFPVDGLTVDALLAHAASPAAVRRLTDPIDIDGVDHDHTADEIVDRRAR